MIRFVIFLLGLALCLVGAASKYPSIPMPIDISLESISLGLVTLAVDVVLMVVGIFLILIALVFHRIFPS